MREKLQRLAFALLRHGPGSSGGIPLVPGRHRMGLSWAADTPGQLPGAAY